MGLIPSMGLWLIVALLGVVESVLWLLINRSLILNGILVVVLIWTGVVVESMVGYSLRPDWGIVLLILVVDTGVFPVLSIVLFIWPKWSDGFGVVVQSRWWHINVST